MRYPKNEISRLDKAAIVADKIQKHWAIKLVLRPIFLVLIPAAFIAYLTNANFHLEVDEAFPSAKDFLTTDLTFIGLAILWAYPSLLITLSGIISERAKKNKDQMPVENLYALLRCLDGVVGLKESRFRNFLSNNTSKNGTEEKEVFRSITQPQIQIAELTRAICDLFNALYPESNQKLIRVVLAQLNGGRVEEIPVHYPNDEDPVASLEVLNSPSSTIMTCLKQRKIIVVSSIKKEVTRHHKKRRFNPSAAKEEGSIICYPIKWGKSDIPFVVSIHCDQDGLFKEAETAYYEFLLERFELRLRLEYNLALIRRETDK